jgi:predicted transcriptional regulator
MVLKGTYGEMVHETFRMTRQGVRWRFQRLFSQVYVEAFETVLMIEKIFGTQLRDYAVRISKERYEMRRETMNVEFETAKDVFQK